MGELRRLLWCEQVLGHAVWTVEARRAGELECVEPWQRWQEGDDAISAK